MQCAAVKIRLELQTTALNKGPANTDGAGTQNLKLCSFHSDLFNSGNDLLAPAGQQGAIELQPGMVRRLFHRSPIKLRSQESLLAIRVRYLGLRRRRTKLTEMRELSPAPGANFRR